MAVRGLNWFCRYLGGQMQDMTLYWQERGGSGKSASKGRRFQRFIIETLRGG